jgi:hypothetical protein
MVSSRLNLIRNLKHSVTIREFEKISGLSEIAQNSGPSCLKQPKCLEKIVAGRWAVGPGSWTVVEADGGQQVPRSWIIRI